MKHAMDNRTERRFENNNYTAPAKVKGQKLVIATAILSLIAVVAAGFMFFTSMNVKTRKAPQPTTAIVTTTQAAPAANHTLPAATQAAPTAKPEAAKPAATQPATVATQPAATQPATERKEESNIRVINGERVFIDTKRPVPNTTKAAAYFHANGKTSYGFNWDYSADNNNFLVRCDYNFDKQEYEFGFYGKAAGTAHITLYYFTDDNTKVPVEMTATVDADLNITLAY